MRELVRDYARPSWGEAEQAALDRCLFPPTRLDDRIPGHIRRLSRTIESEIIPRLMLAHSEAPEPGSRPGAPVRPAEVGEFTRTVLEGSLADAIAATETFRARGLGLDSVFLDLLGPTARLLGDMWREDLCNFTDVTIGLSRLQQVMRELDSGSETECAGQARQVLLAPMPGEQHSFGVSMLGSFFRRAGWTVLGGGALPLDELLDIVRDEWLDAIGVSLSADVLSSRASSVITALRVASRNRSVFIMVGGRYFCDGPDQAVAIGADAFAPDAPEALRLAHRRLESLAAGG